MGKLNILFYLTKLVLDPLPSERESLYTELVFRLKCCVSTVDCRPYSRGGYRGGYCPRSPPPPWPLTGVALAPNGRNVPRGKNIENHDICSIILLKFSFLS